MLKMVMEVVLVLMMMVVEVVLVLMMMDNNHLPRTLSTPVDPPAKKQMQQTNRQYENKQTDNTAEARKRKFYVMPFGHTSWRQQCQTE